MCECVQESFIGCHIWEKKDPTLKEPSIVATRVPCGRVVEKLSAALPKAIVFFQRY